MALSLQRYTWADINSSLTQFLKQRIKNEKERSVVIDLKQGDDLSENLIIEILSWLPVKDLLQYKSVCKSWYAIISSPNFISKHLKNYYNSNDSWRSCLLVQYYVSQAELQLYELLVDETPRVLADEVLYSMPMYGSYVCGPCDGIYYLYEYDTSGRALWNPAINELKMLPKIITKPDLPSKFTYALNEVYGFGLNPVSRDYKVVVIKGYWSDDENNSKHPLSVLVYSLNTGLWRYCGDLAKAYDLENSKCYMYVNGCCYWLGSLGFASEVIISFDMATDAVKEIKIPDYAQPSSKCLGVYDASLAFLSIHENEKNFDVWTYNEGFWNKKLSVGAFSDVRSPVGHWKDNQILLECEDGKLLLYCPDTEEIKDLAFHPGRWCEGSFAYMESLVSIKDKSELSLTEGVES